MTAITATQAQAHLDAWLAADEKEIGRAHV